MKTFKFNHEPTFAELWDACVYNLLYDVSGYLNELKDLFLDLNITKESLIIDVAAGGGFPAIELSTEGYNIVACDGFSDQVDLFNQKAKDINADIDCKKLMWQDLTKEFYPNSFDLLFCRGNSFIYAGGGWNENVEITTNESLAKYKETLSNFYSLLKPGGTIYVDKFKDTETSHREIVGQVQIKDSKPENLVFWTERNSSKKMRQASMILEGDKGERKIPNVTYDLLGSELETVLQEVGFKNIRRMSLKNEKIFDTWIAQR